MKKMSRFSKKSRRDYLTPDKYLTDDEVGRLLAHVRSEANRACRNGTSRGIRNCVMVELMLLTGLRASEICDLKMRDLPSCHGKDVIVVRTGKGGVRRTIDVRPGLRDRLAWYVASCRKGAKPGSYVFASQAGVRRVTVVKVSKKAVVKRHEISARMSRSSLYKIIRRIGQRAGLPWLHPHVLRHTFATHLYADENDLRFTQDQLGHTRPEITERYAGVLNPNRQRQVLNLFAPYFDDKVNNLPAKMT